MDLIDEDQGECRSITRSEAAGSADYVDTGIEAVTAQPDLLTLHVSHLNLTYANGRRLIVAMDSVIDDYGSPATEFRLRDGVIWPLRAGGTATVDPVNTPNIVFLAHWVRREVQRRSATRLELAELTATFAMAVASLGGVAGMRSAAGVPEGQGSRGGRAVPGALAGQGPSPRSALARAEINKTKFRFLFGEATSSPHNSPRTNQNALQMKRLGVYDDEAGHALLSAHLRSAVEDDSNILRTDRDKWGLHEGRESFFIGPSGKSAKLESWWLVMPDGRRELTSVVPIGGRWNSYVPKKVP
ncbi:hypothetical protein LJR013_001993 [Pseudarthrobacter oxydans]|uniref:hypothetical protein n=1 Tax=Pseudarthrobacter oxydans TaxID=1671 RepID=UPI003ECC8B66